MQGCWLHTPFTSFPFTSPPVRHGVPSDFERTTPLYSAYNPRRDRVSKHVQFQCVFPSGECKMVKYEGPSKNFCTSFFLTLLIKNFKNKLHHFSIKSPSFAMHFFQRPTNFLMPSAKNVFGWARSHWCTAAFTSASHENRRVFLSGPKRWKSDGAKFGL